MSDRLRPVSLERLARLLDSELAGSGGSVLGLSRRLVHEPRPVDP